MVRLALLFGITASLVAATPVPQGGGGGHKAMYNVLYCTDTYILNNPDRYEPFDVDFKMTPRIPEHKSFVSPTYDSLKFSVPGGQRAGDYRNLEFTFNNGGWDNNGYGYMRGPNGEAINTHTCTLFKKGGVLADKNTQCRVVVSCVPDK